MEQYRELIDYLRSQRFQCSRWRVENPSSCLITRSIDQASSCWSLGSFSPQLSRPPGNGRGKSRQNPVGILGLSAHRRGFVGVRSQGSFASSFHQGFPQKLPASGGTTRIIFPGGFLCTQFYRGTFSPLPVKVILRAEAEPMVRPR